MNHICSCSIFKSTFMNLKILCIHEFLIQIEKDFMNSGDFKITTRRYQNSYVNLFKFYVKVTMEHMSQFKEKIFISECNINQLLCIMENYFNLSEIMQIHIEMLSEDMYEKLVKNYTENMRSVNYEIFPMKM